MFVVAGPAGAGKTTIATALGERLGWPVLDADDLHTPEAIASIAAGRQLTDADRGPWLDRVAGWTDEHLASGTSGVVACSALRRAHRDVLRRPGVEFLQLAVDPAELAARLDRRRGHFAGPDLLPSQLAALEPLGPDERGRTIDGGPDPARVVDAVLAALILNA